MPQTKPVEIKPEANLEVGWEDIAGVDEAKAELREVVDFLRDAQAVRAPRAPRCPRASCSTGRPARARRCWPRPSPTSRARSSSRSRRRRSWRCSPAWAPRASAACSARRASRAARDHLHRRARRRRRAPRLGQQLRARADAQPAAGRDGRLRLVRGGPRRRHGRLQPAREARPRAAAPGALRPPGLRLAARRRRAASASCACTPPTSRCARTSTSHIVAQQTSGLTGADLANICNEAAIFCGRREGHAVSRAGLRQRARARHRRRAVLDHAQRPRAPRRRLPRGRPRAVPRAARTASTACTRSRSSRAAARWATSSTCPTRTPTSRRARSSSTR